MRIKKDDIVEILTGKDRGQKGRVLKVLSKEGRMVVEGMNLVTKHIRPKREGEKGQKIKMAMPLAASNIMLVCPRCKKAIRVGYKILADGAKKRFCRKCKEII